MRERLRDEWKVRVVYVSAGHATIDEAVTARLAAPPNQ